MIIHSKCPVCQKTAKEVTSRKMLGIVYVSLECGHNMMRKELSAVALSVVSEDGKTPYQYQIDGAKFVIEKAQGRALICDEMGLGKTVQALMVVKNQNWRFLQIVKSGLRIQWTKETERWLGDEWAPQIIENENQAVLPTKGYVVSVDNLWRFKDIPKWLDRLKVNCVILDECQTIKNHTSQRTNAVRSIVEKVKNVIALSGTPIKNHAGEYFPILNMLHPEKFPSLINYQKAWVDTYFDAKSCTYKYGGIRRPEEFKKYTENFILRRTRDDVTDQIQLACGNRPKRDSRFSELGADVNKMYQAQLNEMTEYMLYGSELASASEKNSCILAYMSKMRHITGLAKIEPCINFVEDFLTETDRKITIFCHHEDVMDLVAKKLSSLISSWQSEYGTKIAQIRSSMNMEERNRNVELFRGGSSRIMIASTLASSEGLNLQFCSDYIILERQWNPANEEQAEARFLRIGQMASSVNGTYMIATGTIDEFFAELVERKRGIMANTLDGKEVRWEESSLIKELAEVLVKNNKKGWKL